MQRKAQRISRDTTVGTLEQLKEDMNTGYVSFNAKLSRYFSRKQQFADVKNGESIYQTPVDSIRVIGITISVATGAQPFKSVLKEIRSEAQWRQITAYPYNSNWPVYYYVLGSDEVQIWPSPSQDLPQAMRFYYQQQDHDLSIEDVTSESTTTTVGVVNGLPTVTCTGSVFTPQMQGLWFQLTGVTDLTWYEIVDVPNSTTLTLKSAFVGITGSSQNFRIGQLSILPSEYQDAPIEYALGMFFAGKGNEARAQMHLGTPEKPGRFYDMISDAVQAYSSSTEGNVITEDDNYLNSWFITPLPPTGG